MEKIDSKTLYHMVNSVIFALKSLSIEENVKEQALQYVFNYCKLMNIEVEDA